MNRFEQLKEDFLLTYNNEEFKIIEKLVDSALNSDDEYTEYIKSYGKWECDLTIEKSGSNGSYYHIDIYDTELLSEIRIMFAFGIDAPNDCVDYHIDCSKEKEKLKQVLSFNSLMKNENINFKKNTFHMNTVVSNYIITDLFSAVSFMGGDGVWLRKSASKINKHCGFNLDEKNSIINILNEKEIVSKIKIASYCQKISQNTILRAMSKLEKELKDD